MKPLFLLIPLLLLIQACNFNYHRGLELEEEERFEEANIEFHRAYISDPDDEDYSSAYFRTIKPTIRDLMKRYYRYLGSKEFITAYNRLVRAEVLDPENKEIKREKKKWVRVLLAGKVTLEFESLRRDLKLADEMILAIRLNTPDPSKRLLAPIDNQTGIFAVEDVLYDPPQNLLMFYSINAVGVKMVRRAIGSTRIRSTEFKNFINLRTPVLTNIKGELKIEIGSLRPTAEYYPFEELERSKTEEHWVPPRGIRYSVVLEEKQIKVFSSIDRIDFIPQILYINGQNQRMFLDFGNLSVRQTKVDGAWSFKRLISKGRDYYKLLERNVIFNPYFYFREGGYPFINSAAKGGGDGEDGV